MVISLVAILKAGGCYVPLDPELPPLRKEAMCSIVQPKLVLTHSALASGLSAGRTVVCLDTAETEAALATMAVPAACPADGDSLAYIIFTSGSTGEPKGVMVPHRGIVNRLLWMQDAYRLTGSDRVLQKTPFAFDVSVWEFFWPLMTGARLVLARPDGHKDPAYINRLIAQRHHDDPFRAVDAGLSSWPPPTPSRAGRCVMSSLPARPCLKEHVARFLKLGLKASPITPMAHRKRPSTPRPGIVPAPTWTAPSGRTADRQHPHVRTRPMDAGAAAGRDGGNLHRRRRRGRAGYYARRELTSERFVPDPSRPIRKPASSRPVTAPLAADGALNTLGV